MYQPESTQAELNFLSPNRMMLGGQVYLKKEQGELPSAGYSVQAPGGPSKHCLLKETIHHLFHLENVVLKKMLFW